MVSQADRPVDLTMRALGPDREVTTFLWGKTMLRELQIVVPSADRSEIVAGLSFHGTPIKLQESGLEYVATALRNLLRNKRAPVV
jgi:hypothetical protein